MGEDRHERELTPVEMTAILGAIETSETPEDGLIAALKMTFGCLLADMGLDWDSCESIDGKMFAIPKPQWLAISDALLKRSELVPVESVNHALDWMNRGPSAYEPEKVGR